MNSLLKKHLKLVAIYYLSIPVVGVGLGEFIRLLTGEFTGIPIAILGIVNPSLCAMQRIAILRRDSTGRGEKEDKNAKARVAFAWVIPIEFLFSIIFFFIIVTS